jgi:hypothetical protein
MTTSEPLASRRESWLLLTWAIALFAVCLALHTRHNDFPYYYHPDEPGKVEQVLTGDWNYHHPMLLLSTTKALVEAGGIPREPQSVVEIGRLVSAGFTALAVVALSLLAYAWRGWAPALAAGAALTCHHQFFELAHYFKEDSALLAGLSLSFLMLLACWWRPSMLRTTLLGIACGLAVSGKYLGVVAIFLALPILWREPQRRSARIGVFFAALVMTFVVVNLPLFLHLQTFRESFGREMEFVVKGQRGMTRSVPHLQYWNVFVDNTTPAIWVMLLVFLRARWRERETLSLPEWILIAFPFVYAIALSFSPKTNDRYFLPATALFTLQAAIGTLDLARTFAWRHQRRHWLAGAVAALLLFQLVSLPRPVHWGNFAEYWKAFQIDDNAELITFLKKEVPANAVIAKDNRVALPDPTRKKDAARVGVIPQKVIAERFVADLGTLDQLQAKGITHVVVSESDYGRFQVKSLRPQAGEKEDFLRRQTFYAELQRAGLPVTLLAEWERGTVIYLHPGLRVYRIAP